MSESTPPPTGGGGEAELPFYLMPLAAILGMYALFGSIRLIYLTYSSLTYNAKTATAKQKLNPPKSMTAMTYLSTLVTVIVACVLYGLVVAKVENAMIDADIFDPYDILSLDIGTSNTTVIKSAYRTMSKLHHPDKGGDPTQFHKVNLAYRALTDDISKENYIKYGHPDGNQHTTMSFALPEWLLHPKGNTAVILVVLYLGMFAAIIKFVLNWSKQTEDKASKAMMSTSVDGGDIKYLEKHLLDEKAKLTHLDILLLVATTPEQILLTRNVLEKQEKQRQEKIEALKKSGDGAGDSAGGKKKKDILDMAGDDGWADDNDNDDDSSVDEETKEAERKAKEAEKEAEIHKRQLAASTGKIPQADITKVMMEGIDDGVLGQKWVEGILQERGFWPPSSDVMKKITAAINDAGSGDGNNDDDKKKKDATTTNPLDDPATKRNILMTLARIHSQLLNNHPALTAAAPRGLIDQHYFRYSMEYRQRNGLLLEAALRVGVTNKRYDLVCQIIESVTMFKIGCPSATQDRVIAWFRMVLQRQYGGPDGLPNLKIDNPKVHTEGEEEVATGDVVALEMLIERTHAKKFFEHKVEMCKKQGMDPRMALQTYQEGWWILIRCQSVEDDDGKKKKKKGTAAAAGAATKKKDDDDETTTEKDGETEKTEVVDYTEPKLVLAWPFIVRAIAQKSGKIKVQFRAPSVPGKYRYIITIKSQEFLGCDQTFDINVDVLDQEDVQRKEKEADDDEEGEEDGEKKKKKVEEEGGSGDDDAKKDK